jgi:ATP-dependent Zn protease
MGLQSLLVVMDGIDSPPFFKKLFTSKVNLWLDAFYLPQKIGPVRFRLNKAKPTGNQIYFVGATNVPLESLDPAMTRPGRMGRHIYFRTPTKRDRIDIFDLYLGKVAHEADLDEDVAREELARITDGYSPAKIEQACNLALTYAQHDERHEFSRADILEAMVTVEAGTAVGWGYESSDEERSTAVHEAGHAICSYIYEKNSESVRLSIKKRGMTGGHHMSTDVQERFAYFRHEVFGRLITILGAMAAEYVFYNENTQGVGGDLQMASYLAGTMVGRHGMSAPYSTSKEKDKKYIEIGSKLLAAGNPGDIQLNPRKLREEELIIGQAFVTAYSTCLHNEAGIEKIVTALLRDKEIYGRDLEALLESAGLEEPDYEEWPLL